MAESGDIPCIIYAAKSSADIRASLSSQKADCRRGIESEGRRFVVAEREDEGRTAFRGNRGAALVEAKDLAIKAAAKHGTAELWIQHSDRLARGDGIDADHLAEIWFALRRARVRIRSVQDDHNLEDAIRVVLVGERNHEDSARKSAAIRSGHQRRREAGKPNGPPPDGWMFTPELDADGRPVQARDGRLVQTRVLDPERAPIVRRVFDDVEAGYAYSTIGRMLNERRQLTRFGKEWTASQILAVATNAWHAGWVVSREHGTRVRGTHEPLIDPDRFDRIQREIERRDPAGLKRRNSGRRSGAVDMFLLRGVAFCGYCGRPLYAIPVRKASHTRQYACAAVRLRTGGCSGPRIHADVAEAQVMARLQSFVGDVEAWIAGRATAVDDDRALFEQALRAQRSELARVDRRLSRAREQHDAMLDQEAVDMALVETALRQVSRIEADRSDLHAAVASGEARLREWPTTDIDAALDYYSELREAISGRVAEAKSVLDLNATLRAVLEGVWIKVVRDDALGDMLFADFVLRGPNGGPAPEIAVVTRVDHWRQVLDADRPIPAATVDPDTVIARLSGIAIPPLRVPVDVRGEA